ncbi:MAG: M23 family metallopeptidase [Actinomycetota bacterium]|nr:M23 family metallopeptidase [Actinomycetota bacterium]
MSRLCHLAAVLCALAALAAPAPAAAEDELTAVTASVLATPEAVLADDGRQHLAYELLLSNRASTTVTIRSIKALAGKKVVGSLSGKEVATMMSPFGGKPGNKLGPGQGAFVLMDVSFPGKAKLPRRIVHRLSISERKPSPANATTYLAAPTRVIRTPAVVVAPPLRGDGWVVANGCCDAFTAHRGTVLPVNGANHVAERFAIDFVQIGANGRLLDGPRDAFSSYAYFGEPIYSATNGKVVGVVNDIPETPAGGFPKNPTAQTAGGNHVVIDMGGGRYAFYAHLQPGSATVKVGQRVTVGQVLGRLGNSGNTDAPHLHFHVMDSPSPLASNGLPYRFTSFTVAGTMTNVGPFTEDGAVAQIAPEPRGPRSGMLPLNDQVIGFGS